MANHGKSYQERVLYCGKREAERERKKKRKRNNTKKLNEGESTERKKREEWRKQRIEQL